MADVSVTIDGIKVTVPKGTFLIDAARKAGINISNFCYLPGLRAYGACRMCVVEVSGRKGMETVISCGTPAADGQLVLTNTDHVREEKKRVLQALDVDHPVDCPICEASGRCDLQDYCYEFEVTKVGSLDRPKIVRPLERLSPFIDLDRDRCVLCGRCVRICDETIGAEALAWADRGVEAAIDTPFGKSLLETACTSCGSCVQVCPVGALSSHTYQISAHNWEVQPTRTTCGMCSIGCQEYIETYRDRIVQVSSEDSVGVNDGVLCVSGRYGLDFVNHKQRLLAPMIKRDGKLTEVSWDVALDYVAANLSRYAGEQVAAIGSSHTSNEEAYLLQKIVRGGLKSNNIDHDARLGSTPAMQALGDALGYPAATNGIQDIYMNAGCVLEFNSNLYETHPVFAYNLQKNVRITGQKLIVINPLRTRLVEWATIHLAPRPGTELALLNAMARVIIEEGLNEADYVNSKVDGYEQYLSSLMTTTIDEAAKESGVPAEDIRRAARLYATGGKTEQQGIKPPPVAANTSVPVSDGQQQGISAPAMVNSTQSAPTPENAGAISQSPAQATNPDPKYKASSIVYMPGVIGRAADEANAVYALVNLALLTGNVGRKGGGVNPFVGQNNKQGAADCGCLPNYLPGYQRLDDSATVNKFIQAWGVDALPTTPGRDLNAMYAGAAAGEIKAMFVVGENPVLADPEPERVKRALDNLDFLVVQDIFMTETAEMADAVLPAASFAEKDGTTTNAERRVQRIRMAVEPRGLARPDWAILADLGARLGLNMDYRNPSSIFGEMVKLMPIYAGITYSRLDVARYLDVVVPMPGAISYKQLKLQGYQWPVPDRSSKGTDVLYADGFGAHRPRLRAVMYTAPPATTEQMPLILTAARSSYAFNMGTLSRYSRMLNIVEPDDGVRVNPADARQMGVANGAPIKLFTSVGEAKSKLIVTEDVPRGQAFLASGQATRDDPIRAAMVARDGYQRPDSELIPDLRVLMARIEQDK
jgi:predicted molibdopterin-dependent oxidoreductase YjgC